MSQVLHQKERRQFERLLHQQRMKRVADRLTMVKAPIASEEHFSAPEWQKRLARAGVDLEPQLLAQTLELLIRFGLAASREFEGSPPHYEHRHLDEHSDHLICTSYGAISEGYDLDLEVMQQKCHPVPRITPPALKPAHLRSVPELP